MTALEPGRRPLALLLLALLAVGASATPSPGNGAAGRQTVREVKGAVVYQMALPERVTRPDPVTIRLSVTNNGTTPVTFQFTTAQRYDVVVRHPGGEQAVVWTWSGGRMFAQVLGSLVLTPRETRTYDIAWPLNDAKGQPVGPGRYQMQVRFLGRPADPMNASGTIPPLTLLVK